MNDHIDEMNYLFMGEQPDIKKEDITMSPHEDVKYYQKAIDLMTNLQIEWWSLKTHERTARLSKVTSAMAMVKDESMAETLAQVISMKINDIAYEGGEDAK